MSDQSEVDRILSQYGQGFTSPALNSGDGEIASTPDILAQYGANERMSQGVPGFLRRIGAGLRSLAPSQVTTPVNTLTGREPLQARERHANPLMLMGGEGADTMASWMDMHPGVDRGQSRPQDLLAPLGLSAMAPLTAVNNAAGIFGGRLARTADREALSRAEEMAGRGTPRNEIWDNTGWFQGRDGQWRFEIDDSQMRHVIPPVEWIPRREDGRPLMAPNLETAYDRARENLTPQAPVRASRLFEHELLERAYPHGFTRNDQHQSIMGMPVQLIEGGNSAGMFIGNHPTASIGLHETLPPGTARSAALHELQHAIQRREGFAEGASPNDPRLRRQHDALQNQLSESIAVADMRHMIEGGTEDLMSASDWIGRSRGMDPERLRRLHTEFPADEINRRVEYSRDQMNAVNPSDLYHRTAGEVEARNVQTRRDFSPEARRAVPPWQSQDVPDADQILRQYSSGPQMSVPDTKGPRRPQPSEVTEWPVSAAIKVGDNVYGGTTHFDAIRNSVPNAVERDLFGDDLSGAFRSHHGTQWEELPFLDGFVTNTGRYVSRDEAAQLASAKLGRNIGTTIGLDAVAWERALARQEGRRPHADVVPAFPSWLTDWWYRDRRP